MDSDLPSDNEYTISQDGKVSRLDRWNYNDTLNILVRNALFTKGTPQFGYWVDRFASALRVISLRNLPLKRKINEVDMKFRDEYYWDKVKVLKQHEDIWADIIKRDCYLDEWEEEYWVALFFLLDGTCN